MHLNNQTNLPYVEFQTYTKQDSSNCKVTIAMSNVWMLLVKCLIAVKKKKKTGLRTVTILNPKTGKRKVTILT